MPKEKKTENDGNIKKTGKLKKFVIIAAGLFVMLFLIGVFSGDDTKTTQTSDLSEAEDSIAGTVLSEKEDGIRTEQDAEADNMIPETDISNIENKKDEQSNKKDTVAESNIQADGAEEYIYTLAEYPFQDKKYGKKIVELYEKALDAERDEFICLTEEEKIHMLSSTEVWYKKSLDTDHAPFRYYGEVDGDGYPDGFGMLVRNWDELYRDAADWTKMFMAEEDYGQQEEVCVEIIYIGGFKDGFKEGYGINFGVGGLYEMPIIADEGDFMHGKMDGDGISYIGLAGGGFDEDFNNMLAEAYYVEYSETTNSGLLFPAVVKSNLYFEGMYKGGEFDGKGKEYYLGENEENKLRLKYEGEFKNGHYSGMGILYFEDETIRYKGEFKNGKYNGKGTLYDEQGKVLHKGKFENGDVK